MDVRYDMIPMPGAAGTPAKQIDLNSLTVQAHYCPIVKMKIRMCCLVIMNVVAAAGIVLFKWRPTAGSAAGEVTVATLNLATTHDGGEIIYKDSLDFDCTPGGEVVVEVTDATGAGDLGFASMWCQVEYETPANNSRFVATT